MVAVYDDQLTEEMPVLSSAQVGGVIVMDAISTQQLQDIHSSIALPPLIAVDQEGGTVQRYTSEGTLPGASTIAQQDTTGQAYTMYLDDDRYLKQLGITTNFAPVLGVITGTNNVLPGRMYGDNPTTVIAYASAAVRPANDAGLTPVVKHFPGLGTASGNTDYGSATTAPLSSLQSRDMKPYSALASLHPDAMVSNAIVPGLTDGQPAIWSAKAVQMLRSMGYQQAVIYSDSLTAQSVPGTLGDATVKAWEAGIDVALIVQKPADTPQLASDIQAITDSAEQAVQAGALSPDSIAASGAAHLCS